MGLTPEWSPFNGFDLFNRIVDQRWLNYNTSTDLDRYQYGYDQDSNRIWKANTVTTGLDEFYTYDQLNRLTKMQRGTLNAGKTGISGTPVREMDYTLDPTGNWPAYVTLTSGTTDLSQTRTSNKVNEITAIGGTPTWAAPAYDAAGNMTTMPQVATPTSSFTALYDAWNRMVKLSAGGSTVATYGYDGQNRRIVKVTTATSETRHFYYSSQWQDIEERTGSPATMERQYVWGIRYVDELVCRDRTISGFRRINERLYAMQDANFNLTAICDTSGAVQERYRYDPYGSVIYMSASWSVLSASAKAWQINHQGLLQDAESGLIYNRNRMLHPLAGRFNTRDPIGYRNDLSLYVYLRGNPSGLRDPRGTHTWDYGGDYGSCAQQCDAIAAASKGCPQAAVTQCKMTCFQGDSTQALSRLRQYCPPAPPSSCPPPGGFGRFLACLIAMSAVNSRIAGYCVDLIDCCIAAGGAPVDPCCIVAAVCVGGVAAACFELINQEH